MINRKLNTQRKIICYLSIDEASVLSAVLNCTNTSNRALSEGRCHDGVVVVSEGRCHSGISLCVKEKVGVTLLPSMIK